MPDSEQPAPNDDQLQRPNDDQLQRPDDDYGLADRTREIIRLSADEAERFSQTLLEPPPISYALKKAAELHRMLIDPS